MGAQKCLLLSIGDGPQHLQEPDRCTEKNNYLIGLMHTFEKNNYLISDRNIS